MDPARDVRFGKATVPVHPEGGWALPGGGRTLCNLEALSAAAELDSLIAGRETTEAGSRRKPVHVHQAPVITRRKVDFLPWLHSRT